MGRLRLHLVPLPELNIDPGHQMIVADSGMQMPPQGGYLEGFDRVLAMSGRVARSFLLEPFFFLVSFRQTCTNCQHLYQQPLQHFVVFAVNLMSCPKYDGTSQVSSSPLRKINGAYWRIVQLVNCKRDRVHPMCSP